jgi:hypothetical protein
MLIKPKTSSIMEAQVQLLPLYLRDLSSSDAAYARVRKEMLDRLGKDTKYSWTKSPADDKCMFMLIEPRDHPNTEFVLKVASHMFSAHGHGLLIVHGCANGDFMKTCCKDIENVNFLELPGVDNLPIPAYNELLMSSAFWRVLPHENIVLFQTDVIFLHRGSDLLDDFVRNYDYIGAPWWNIDPFVGVLVTPDSKAKLSGRIVDQAFVAETGPDCVGNGGLSYRKRSAMIRSIEELRAHVPCANEDVFFAVAAKRLGLRVPKRSIAMQYSVEMCLPSDTPLDRPWTLGVHRVWAYHPADIVERILRSSTLLTPCDD